MDIIRVVDTESTGLPPDCEAIEIGWTDVTLDGEILNTKSMLIKPSRPIEFEAMAVHHITQEEADLGCQDDSWRQAVMGVHDYGNIVAFAAHNAEFERALLPEITNWICTYRCSLVTWFDLDKHSNQYLKYALNLDLDRNRAFPVHRAGPDSYVTAGITSNLLHEMTLEQMYKATNEPILLKKMPFGKHAKQPIQTLPPDYMRWVRDNIKDDPDLVYTVKHHLALRDAEHRRKMASEMSMSP